MSNIQVGATPENTEVGKMELKKYPLGDYYQLLQKEGLLPVGSVCAADLGREVRLVSCDSQQVDEGTLFIVKGAHFKEEYLLDAEKKGAFVYVAQQPLKNVTIPCITVTDVRRAMALFADLFYHSPSHHMNVVGITGTKGKSTTACYLKYILDEYEKSKGGQESGIIGSIDTYDGVERLPSKLTTPEPLELERRLANAVSVGMEYLTMELSSQGLKYDRAVNVRLAAAVFLNIGEDHISPIEHSDLEDYFSAKLRIFEHSDVAVVNLDCDHVQRVMQAAKSCPRVLTFSQTDPGAVVYASDVRKSEGEIVFKVKTPRFLREFRLTMPGLFNVQNALAAIAVCEGLGIPEQCIYVGLLKARVSGRMEIFTNADKRIVTVVDYAHNGLSFQKLFESVKEEYPGRRIVSVFGCPGDKAMGRRRDLGEIAGRWSDLVILTEDDPGEEAVEDICRQIAPYVEAQGCQYSIQPDREQAVRQAIMGCEGPSVILLAGKGGEGHQKRGTEYVACTSDMEYARQFLHEYDVEHGLDGMEKVKNLLSLLPTLKNCEGKTVVVKYGGSTLGSMATDTILADVAALRTVGARMVLVHGGGKDISSLLKRLDIPTHFENGYRVTDEETLAAAEMALSARVNKSIVMAFAARNVKAVGISGKDGGLISAKAKDPRLGRVGEITAVDPGVVQTLLEGGYLPVISPIAAGEDGGGYNCNADDAACWVAEALHADKLIFLTDMDGILMDCKNEKTLISHMDRERARELMENGLIAGGMVPKVLSCIHAVEHGVGAVGILNGGVEHALLLEALSPNSLGTTITKD